MISYSKTIIHSRWDSMPENLREILSSPAYGGTVFEVANDHHLSEEKIKILLRLVSFVIYGLIHVDELNKKITKELDIDKKAAEEIAEELSKKIFSQFKSEISTMYSPVPTNEFEEEVSETKKGKTISVEGVAGNINIGDPSKDQKIEISKEEPKEENNKKETIEPKKDAEPFILSQNKESDKEDRETQRKNVEKRKKSFSFATDGFFSSNKKDKESPKADVQAPGNKDGSGGGFFGFGSKKKKKKEEKIVHYSDNRTPLSDDKNDNFINLSNLKPTDSKKVPKDSKINKNLENKQNLNKTKDNKNKEEESFIKRKPPEKIIDKNTKLEKNSKKEQAKKIEEKTKEKSKNKDNDSFLGNINITKNDKKIEEKERNKNSDGPELDGNTVNLKNK